MFSDFPSLHPLIVHFPIVLILISVAFQTAVVCGNWQQIRWATLFIMGGAFFAALAASTVFHAMPSDDAPKEAMEIFADHERFAEYTLWMSGITFLLRCIGEFFKIFRRPYEILVLVAAMASATFLSIAGHHGARLTHVAGIGPMGRYLMKNHHGSGQMKDMDHSEEMKGDSTMQMDDDHEMKDMPGMDTVKKTNDMKDMPGMEKKDDKKMKDMGKMKNMKGMDGGEKMKDMPGMDKMETKDEMKGMNESKDTKGKQDMKSMAGMEKMESVNDRKGMNNMKDMNKSNDMNGMDMNEMDTTSAMKMPGMNMKTNPLDTFRFEDNNPAYKKSKKKSKQ